MYKVVCMFPRLGLLLGKTHCGKYVFLPKRKLPLCTSKTSTGGETPIPIATELTPSRSLLQSPSFWEHFALRFGAGFVMSMSDLFQANPYETHAGLTPLEANVLWEYAKLSQHVKDLTVTTRHLSEGPDDNLIARLRVLERKMGLVLTLFKASVWGVINEQPVQGSEREYAHTAADTTLRR